jgi:hypothetical protein
MKNRAPKFWFTSETPLPCFGSDFSHSLTRPVTHISSRKEFFAKLLGVVAISGFFPRLFARSAAATVESPAAGPDNQPSLPFSVRQDPRSVARRADAV